MSTNELVEKYLIEEMKVVRDRTSAEINVMNQYEVLSLGFVGAIFALIFQYHVSDRVALFVITMLPLIVGVYGLLRYRSHAKIVMKYNSYLTAVEALLRQKDPSFIGLATFYEASKVRSYIKWLRTCFWITIVVLALALTLITQINPDRLARSIQH